MNEIDFMRAANCSAADGDTWFPLFVSAFEEFGITDRLDRAMIIGLSSSETDRFRKLSETFNYSSGALRREFGTRFSPYQAAMLGFQMLEKEIPLERQIAIANLAYGGRMGNGAREGYTYRARGVLPIRGKKVYKEASELVGVDFVAAPDSVADPRLAVRIACAMFTARSCSGIEATIEVVERLQLDPHDEKDTRRGLAVRRARAELPK